MKEAFDAGFTMEQLHQAEEELALPTTESPKVCLNLKEGSISKKLVDLWISNHRSKVRPWKGPLPPPRQSPMRTLGDAITNAKIELKNSLLSLVP
jgi:hypothetical protein